MQPIWNNSRDLRKNATDAQRKLWQHLRNRQVNGIKFRRQYPIAGYVADFAAPSIRLVIELDGGQHLLQTEYDQQRTERLGCNGYKVLRFWNDDVLLRTEQVLSEIIRVTDLTPPHPSPAFSGAGAQGRSEA